MSYGRNGEKSNPFSGPKKAQREVFPSGEIPHKWAHQTQLRARNPTGNLFFEGPTIYSYRRSWPLARIYNNKRGDTLVLSNSESYSVTTNQHQNAVNRAAQHLSRIAVPRVECDYYSGKPLQKQDHYANIAYLIERMNKAHDKAKRAMQEANVNIYLENASTHHKALADYLIFFGIRRKMPALPDFIPLFERVRRIENPDPQSLDRRERRNAQRAALKAEKEKREAEREALANACARTNWRLHGAFYEMYAFRTLSYAHEPVMLRLNDDEIETSMGARIPAAHAPMLWRAVERVIASGVPYEHNGHSIHAGDYRIDAIDVDGTLHAGCHTIEHSELRAMARQLGLA